MTDNTNEKVRPHCIPLSLYQIWRKKGNINPCLQDNSVSLFKQYNDQVLSNEVPDHKGDKKIYSQVRLSWCVETVRHQVRGYCAQLLGSWLLATNPLTPSRNTLGKTQILSHTFCWEECSIPSSSGILYVVLSSLKIQ